MEQASPFQGVVNLPRAIGREYGEGWLGRLDRAELGHGDGKFGQGFEQEGLELIIRPVDLVDQQDGWCSLERLKDRTRQEEAPIVESSFQSLAGFGGRWFFQTYFSGGFQNRAS